jgi:hypothetical protein
MKNTFQLKVMLTAILSAYAMPTLTYAETLEVEKIEVISTTSLKGIGLQIAYVPASVQTATHKQLETQKSTTFHHEFKSKHSKRSANE